MCELPVSFSLASLGGKVQVPTLSGIQTVEVLSGTQPGDTIQMRSKGLPRLGRSGRGDQYVKVSVEIPRKLSKKQKELLQEFRRSEQKSNGFPQIKSFLEKLKGCFSK